MDGTTIVALLYDFAPRVCPVCKHPQAYFEERKINY